MQCPRASPATGRQRSAHRVLLRDAVHQLAPTRQLRDHIDCCMARRENLRPILAGAVWRWRARNAPWVREPAARGQGARLYARTERAQHTTAPAATDEPTRTAKACARKEGNRGRGCSGRGLGRTVRVRLIGSHQPDDVRVRQVGEHGDLAGEVLERGLGGHLVDDLHRALLRGCDRWRSQPAAGGTAVRGEDGSAASGNLGRRVEASLTSCRWSTGPRYFAHAGRCATDGSVLAVRSPAEALL